MVQKIRFSAQWVFLAFTGTCLLALSLFAQSAHAITQIPTPPPSPGSFGIAATKTQAPPTQGATIGTPGNGASFNTSPITVNGICPTGLLVQVYDNGVMVGSVMCVNGSYSLQISLFPGTNELTVIVYDDLGQAGPTSNTVTVTYTDTNFSAFGTSITLTSSYGRRSAAANSQLDWPLQLSGGTGPYAFSIDWGDGTPSQLKSQALAGLVTISHAYKKAGIYQVNIRVTDKNGLSAFLQVIAVANGKVDTSTAAQSSGNDVNKTASAKPPQILWIPIIVLLLLLPTSYWLGRRSELIIIRNKMLHDRDKYEKEQKR